MGGCSWGVLKVQRRTLIQASVFRESEMAVAIWLHLYVPL